MNNAQLPAANRYVVRYDNRIFDTFANILIIPPRRRQFKDNMLIFCQFASDFKVSVAAARAD